MNKCLYSKYSFSQQGYVLVMTLIMLVLFTIMALTQASLNLTQTRIAGNLTDSKISFEKAEGATNQGINYIFNGTYPSTLFSQNNNGFYVFDMNNNPLWTIITWTGASVISSFNGGSGAAASYLIEQLPSVVKPGQDMKTPTNVYRITARAIGASGNTSVILQTTVQATP